MLRRVALVRTDISEEPSASIRVTRIGELGTTLAATSNRRTLRRNTKLVLFLAHRFLSPWWRRRSVPPKRRFLQEPHSVTSQKTPFFIILQVIFRMISNVLRSLADSIRDISILIATVNELEVAGSIPGLFSTESILAAGPPRLVRTWCRWFFVRVKVTTAWSIGTVVFYAVRVIWKECN
jgi:hypothetical protein